MWSYTHSSLFFHTSGRKEVVSEEENQDSDSNSSVSNKVNHSMIPKLALAR